MKQIANAAAALFAAASMLAISAAGGLAQSVEEFYRANPVRLLIGYSPGGGFDLYGRMLARHLGKHIPGNPEVIVENMPGAGSISLANHLANVAPRDATVIGAVSAGLAVEPLLGDIAQFDAQELTWIGSLTDEISVCAASRASGIENWDQVLSGEKSFTVGGSGAASDVEVFTRMLIALFDANLNLISGYPGTVEMSLAVEQGEIDGRCGWFWSSLTSAHSDWLASGELNVLVQLSPYSAPGLEDVPLITEYAESQEELQILQLVLSRMAMARPYVAPPDLPEDRAEALRQAFMDAANDPELVAEAEQFGFALNPMSGEALTEMIVEMYLTPPEVVERTREVIAIR